MGDALNTVLTALVPVVVAYLGYLLRRFTQAKLAPQQLEELHRMAQTAVTAADKVADSWGITNIEKYKYAEQALTTFAKRLGVKLKPEEANAVIHSVLSEVRQVEELLNQPDVVPEQEAA